MESNRRLQGIWNIASCVAAAAGSIAAAPADADKLYFVLRAGDLFGLRELPEHWISPNKSDSRQITLLMYAAEIGSPGNLLLIADDKERLEATVTICLVTDPDRLIVDAAETLASQMFCRIRVRLQWYGPPVCPAGAADTIFVMIQTHTPEGKFPGALGVALPLEGSHASVFYDRVLPAGPGDSRVAALLAHVMAHEIAHLLQGIVRHSESGILKARWSATDLARMAYFPLMFAPEDAILINHGLEERHARLVSSGFAGAPSNRSDEIGARKERSLLVP